MQKHIVCGLWETQPHFWLQPCAARFMICEQFDSFVIFSEQALCEVIPTPQNSLRWPFQLPAVAASYISQNCGGRGLEAANDGYIAEMHKRGYNRYIHSP